jgi:hypothetical protein
MEFGGNGAVVSLWLVPCFYFFLLFDFVSCGKKKWRGTYPLDPLAMATKRARAARGMATMTTVAGNKEGNGEGC